MTRVALLVLSAVGLAATAQAGLFGHKNQEPRAVDSPVVRPKVKEEHKIPHQIHPSKYNDPTWGNLWKQVFRTGEPHFDHYLR